MSQQPADPIHPLSFIQCLRPGDMIYLAASDNSDRILAIVTSSACPRESENEPVGATQVTVVTQYGKYADIFASLASEYITLKDGKSWWSKYKFGRVALAIDAVG